MEEGGLYREVVEVLIGEHVDLAHGIEHVDDLPEDWGPAAVRLLDALDTHIFKEEWDLFPAAFGLLDFDDLDAMAEVHAQEGSAMDEVSG